MKLFATIVVACGSIALAGCNAQTKASIGKSGVTLLAANGAPDRQVTLPDSSKVYTYERKNAAGGVGCTELYTLNAAGIVVEARERGSDC